MDSSSKTVDINAYKVKMGTVQGAGKYAWVYNNLYCYEESLFFKTLLSQTPYYDLIALHKAALKK